MATRSSLPNSGYQIVATRLWLPDLGCQILATVYRILATRCWLPYPGYQILANRSWLEIWATISWRPRPRYQILATRSWPPDPGYQILATRYWQRCFAPEFLLRVSRWGHICTSIYLRKHLHQLFVFHVPTSMDWRSHTYFSVALSRQGGASGWSKSWADIS